MVRVEAHLAGWTPRGWASEDPVTAAFCEYAFSGAGIPLPWFSNRQRSFAEQLLAVCRRENIDAELISLGGSDLAFTDPDDPDAVF